MRICLVPRWGGGPDDGWYPWLARSLAEHDVRVARLRPSPSSPTIEACLAELRAVVGTDPAELEGTVLVGHSVGCQAALRFLESLPEGLSVAGTVCVAAWWWIDEPWDSIRPWIERPMDHERVRRAAGRLVALISGDDPFTSAQQDNARAWERDLGARVHLLDRARHFDRAREPEVLAEVRATLGR